MSDFERENRMDEQPQPAQSELNLGNQPQLEQELEEIKEMFQQELDNQTSQTPQDDLFEQGDEGSLAEDEEILAQAEPQEERELVPCACCGENFVDFSLGENNCYCTQCHEKFVKTPFGIKGFLCLLVVVLVCGSAMIFGASQSASVESFMTAVQADTAYQSKKLSSAAYYYRTYITSVDSKTVGKFVAKRAVDTFAVLGDYQSAADIVTKFFSDTDKKLPMFKDMANVVAKSEGMSKAREKIIGEIIQPKTDGKPESEWDVKGILKEIDALKAEDDANLALMKEFYKMYVLVLSSQPLQQQYDQLKKIEALDREAVWAYLDFLANVCGKMSKDPEKQNEALALADKALALNAEDVVAYEAKACVYRFGEQPDGQKVIDTIQQALQIQPDYEAYRLLAIGNLMLGKYEEAMSAINSSLQYGYSYQNLYTAAVCAVMLEDDETYGYVKDILESNQAQIPDEIVKLKNGKIKLDKLLYDEEGVLA